MLEISTFSRQCSPAMNSSLSFADGFATGFRIPIPERFADAFANKALSRGDIFYSTRQAYAESDWNEVVRGTEFVIQIRESLTGGETVLFERMDKDSGKLVSKGVFKANWSDFMDILRTADFSGAKSVAPDAQTQKAKAPAKKQKEYVLKTIPAEHDASPPNAINFKYRLGREMDELIGLCRGVLCDGVVTEAEVRYLEQWLRRNEEIARFWPAKPLAKRLERILADGSVSEAEGEDLKLFLEKMTGEIHENVTKLNQAIIGDSTASTTLPLDDPQPEIFFEGNLFCFTGKFLSGTRGWCENEVTKRGAKIASASNSDFLVIGALGSRDWAHSSFGRKIEAAMERRQSRGGSPKIVAEAHWLTFI